MPTYSGVFLLISVAFVVNACDPYPDSFPTLGPIVSIAPVHLEFGQTAQIHAFTTRPVVIRLKTLSNRQNQFELKEQYFSRPFHNFHRTVIDYDCPLDVEDLEEEMTKWPVRVQLTANFLDQKSDQTEEENEPIVIKHRFTVSRRDKMLFIETDKPQYKQNETVHFSVSVIRPESWTLYKTANLSERITAMVDSDRIDSIIVRTPMGVTVEQWTNITEDQAQVLSVSLPADAMPGNWSIVCSTGEFEARTVFLVSDVMYALPTVHFGPMLWSQLKHDLVQMKLCANASDGKPARGPVKLQICQCWLDEHMELVSESSYLKMSTDSWKLLRTGVCPEFTVVSYSKPCAFDNSLFDEEGCAIFSIFLTDLTKGIEGVSEIDRLTVCTEFLDHPTNQSFGFCNQDQRPPSTDLKPFVNFPSFYKPGIPTRTKLTFSTINLSGRSVSISVEPDYGTCPWTTDQAPSNNLARRIKHVVQSTNSIDVTIPPIYSMQPMRIDAHLDTEDGSPWHLRELSSQTLNGMFSFSGEYIQVWSTDEQVNVDCTDSVQLTIMANTPITEIPLFVYGYARGTILPLNWTDAKSQANNANQTIDRRCKDQKELFGHFECMDDGTAKCLSGWQGHDCNQPICTRPCHPVNGFCSKPETCECHQGLMNVACYADEESALDRSVAETSNTTFAQINSTTSMLHPRVLNISSFPNIVGELPLVIFYIKQLDTDQLELITTHTTIYINDRQFCTSETRTGKERNDSLKPSISFKPNVAKVGSNVTLTILLPIAANTQFNSRDIRCQVRVWDDRLLSMSTDAVGRNLLSAESFQSMLKLVPHRSTFPNLLASSHLDLWYGGFGQGFTTVGVDHSNEECFNPYHIPRIEHAWQPKQKFWNFQTPLFRSDRPRAIANQLGMQYNFTVPSEGRYWRASVFCHGNYMGIWSNVSSVLPVETDIDVELRAVSHAKLLELVRVDALVTVGSLLQSTCLLLRLKFIVDPERTQVSGPADHLHCACERGQYTYTTWVSLRLPGQCQISAELQVTYSPTDCDVADSVESVYVATRRAMHIICTSPDKSDVLSGSFLTCITTDEQSDSRKTAHIVVPQQFPPDVVQSTVKAYLSYSADVVGPTLMNYVDLAEEPVSNTYYHLAMVSTGAEILKFLREQATIDDQDFRSLSAQVYRMVVKHFNLLQDLRCVDNEYAFYADDCNNTDPWFNTLVYEVFGHFDRTRGSLWDSLDIDRAFRHSRRYGYYPWPIYFNVKSHTLQLLQSLQSMQDETGCIRWRDTYSTSHDSANSNFITVNAHVYVVLKNRLPHDMVRDNRVLVNIEKSIQSCLLNLTLDVYGNPRPIRYNSRTLAYLAHALSLMEPPVGAVNQLIRMLKRMARMSHSRVDGDEEEMYWESNNVEDTMDTTKHAYMAMAETAPLVTELESVIRWIIRQQGWRGQFQTYQQLLSATSVLFDFSSRLTMFRKIYRQSNLEVNFQADALDSPIHRKLTGHLRTIGEMIVLDESEPYSSELTANFQIEQPFEACFVGKVAYLYRTNGSVIGIVTVKDRNYGLNISHSIPTRMGVAREEECKYVYLELCFPTERNLTVQLYPQTGWALADAQNTHVQPHADKNPSSSFRWTFGQMDSVSIAHRITNNSQYSEQLQEKREQPCVTVKYQRTGVVQLVQPLRLIVADENEPFDEKIIDYRLPNCEVNTHEYRLNGILPVPAPIHFSSCPQLVSSDTPQFVDTLVSLCDSLLYAFRFVDRELRAGEVHIHRIDHVGVVSSWSTWMEPGTRACFATNSSTVYMLAASELFRNNAHVIPFTHSLVDGFRKMLQNGTCTNLNTAIRLLKSETGQFGSIIA